MRGSTRIFRLLIWPLLAIFVSFPPLPLTAFAKDAETSFCVVTVSVEPPTPQVLNELESLVVIVRARYHGLTRVVNLSALGLPSFASGWTGNRVAGSDCTVADTVYLQPGACDKGDYHIMFIGTADGEKGLSDTLHYELQVIDVDRSCQVDAGPDRTVVIGKELSFAIVATDPDTICGEDIPLSWYYWGYPFNHGAILDDGTWTRIFTWVPDQDDEGTHYAYFQILSGACISVDSIMITVQRETDCIFPIIIAEPEFTPGTFNTIYYIPACGAFTHEVCYFDYEAPEIILGCKDDGWKKTISLVDTMSVTYEDLEDGHKYGYFVKAYFAESPDSITLSNLTSSTQDASPPDSVNDMEAYADSGGAVIVNWYGVNDRVSYVNRYEVYRKESGQFYSIIATVPATENNSPEISYVFPESLAGHTGLEEGVTYHYTIRAIDTVGNRGGGIESGAVVPDSTPPCLPQPRIAYDYRFMNTCYVRGVECEIWDTSNCSGMQKTHFIRFQAVRDSIKYFESQWHPDYDFFESGWLPYNDDSISYIFDLLPSSNDSSYVNGHRYYYRAQAKDSLGNMSYWTEDDSVYNWSRPVSAWQDAYPPGDISNLIARPRINQEGDSYFVEINWDSAYDAVSGLKKYYVYRKLDDAPYNKIDSTANTSYNDPCRDVDTRRQLCYRIGSTDYVGNERDYLRTNWEACVKPHAGPVISLDCDILLNDSMCYTAADSIAVFWYDYDNTGVSKYMVVSNTDTCYQNDPAVDHLIIPITDDGTYHVKARAIFFDGTVSTWSNTESVVKDATPPDPVITLSARNDTSYSGNIHLEWNTPYDTTGIDYYKIFRRTPETEFDFVDTTEDTTWIDYYSDSLIVYQFYVYKVHPVDLLGNEQKEGNKEDSAYCNKPPTIIDNSVHNEDITIYWDRAAPNLSNRWLDSVIVYDYDDLQRCTTAVLVMESSFSFSAATFKADVYVCRVKEISIDLDGAYSSAWSAAYFVPYDTMVNTVEQFELQPQPIPPKDMHNPVGKMQLAWKYPDRTFIDSFIIVRYGSGRIEDTTVIPGDSSRFLDSGIVAFTDYTYCITALNIFGRCGDDSCLTDQIDPAWMFTPKVKEDSTEDDNYFGGDSLIVKWGWVDKDMKPDTSMFGAESCQVEVSVIPDFDSLFTVRGEWVPAEQLVDTIIVSSLQTDNKIFYRRIRAKDKWENVSPWSDEYFGNAPIKLDNNPPLPISNPEISSQAHPSPGPQLIDIRLDWQGSSDAESGLKGYKIYRDRCDDLWVCIDSTPDTFYDNIGLEVPLSESDCEYRYKIQPIDSVGNEREDISQTVILPNVAIPFLKQPSSKRSISWNFDGRANSFYAERSEDSASIGTVWMNLLPKTAKALIEDTSMREHEFEEDEVFDREHTIYFHIKAVRGNFESGWSSVRSFSEPGSQYAGNNSVPDEFELLQNYPNPFNPVTKISFGLPNHSRVCLQVFNIRGEIVKILVDRELASGRYEILWDGTNRNGNPVASGIYLYKIKIDNYTATRKMLLLR